jgi:hypothetical protein
MEEGERNYMIDFHLMPYSFVVAVLEGFDL